MFGHKCCVSKGSNQCGNVDSEFLIELLNPPVDREGSHAAGLQPYVTLTADIWGRRVRAHLWVGWFSRFPADFYARPVSSCAFTHTGTGRMETQRSEAEVGQWSRRGGQPLAEVVFCAVGRVVMLPLVEMTAQSTALLALVTDGAGVEPDPRKRTSS